MELDLPRASSLPGVGNAYEQRLVDAARGGVELLERERARLREDARLGRVRQVHEARALEGHRSLVGARGVGPRSTRARDQRGLHLLRCPPRMKLDEQSGGSGDVRGRHARAVEDGKRRPAGEFRQC
jgi:hypothetical protein